MILYHFWKSKWKNKFLAKVEAFGNFFLLAFSNENFSFCKIVYDIIVFLYYFHWNLSLRYEGKIKAFRVFEFDVSFCYKAFEFFEAFTIFAVLFVRNLNDIITFFNSY